MPLFFIAQLLSMGYQIDEKISTIKLYVDIFALYRHTFCYLHAKNAELLTVYYN